MSLGVNWGVAEKELQVTNQGIVSRRLLITSRVSNGAVFKPETTAQMKTT